MLLKAIKSVSVIKNCQFTVLFCQTVENIHFRLPSQQKTSQTPAVAYFVLVLVVALWLVVPCGVVGLGLIEALKG